MDLSTYVVDKIYDHIFRNQAYTPVSTIYVAAHTADPGVTGASELAGAGYARQALALNATGGDRVTENTSQIQIPMPSAGGPYTIPSLGVWDASTAGNFLHRAYILGTNVIAVGAATGDLLTSYGHGLTTDDRVIFHAGGGQGLPAGITAGTIYFVLASGLTTDAFKISTTSGGGALDITADGEAIARKVQVKSLNATDLLQINASQLVLSAV